MNLKMQSPEQRQRLLCFLKYSTRAAPLQHIVPQSHQIYNNRPEWECTWAGLWPASAKAARTREFLRDDSPSHSANSAGSTLFICLTSLHPGGGAVLSSRGSASPRETEESRQRRNCFQSGTLWAPVLSSAGLFLEE